MLQGRLKHLRSKGVGGWVAGEGVSTFLLCYSYT